MVSADGLGRRSRGKAPGGSVPQATEYSVLLPNANVSTELRRQTSYRASAPRTPDE
ncbi:Hypothetical predicted protein [Marmota monax]|uniref:Uncharacterized protein n=1 Tax=Marmota monax TaxID=9995 RepID=A0A5E4AWX4_MARMO|nr:Hypothetical predicted protein [Marmota monax]